VQESGQILSPLPCIGRDIRVEAACKPTRNQGGTVRRETIAIIWIGGLLLAVALYAVGPDRFLDACLDFLNGIEAVFHSLVYSLGAQVFGIVRALAIAIYVVFVVLAFLAAQRGQRGSGH
jgi:predicted DNA repair protein MutK